MAVSRWTLPVWDGWFSKFSPNGRYIAYGFGRSPGVVEVATNTVVASFGEDSGWQIIGWPSDDELLIQKPIGVFRVRPPLFNTPEPVLPGHEFTDTAAAHGHWVSTFDYRIHRVYRDGAVIAPGAFIEMEPSGRFVFSRWMNKIDNWRNFHLIVHGPDGTFEREVLPQYPASEWRIGENHIGYGYFSQSWLAKPDGTHEQVNLIPHESPALAFRWRGALWLITSGEQGDCAFVYLRPLQDDRTQAITIEMPAVRAEICLLPSGDLLVAGNATTGRLQIARVPVNEPLAPVEHVIYVEPLPAQLCGYFFAVSRADRYDTNLKAPGNCVVIAERGLDTPKFVVLARLDDKTDVPLIPEWANRWDRVHAIYLTPETGNSLDYEIKRAHNDMDRLHLPRRPLISYTGPVLQTHADITWPGIECYPAPGETPEFAAQRWRLQVRKTNKPVVLIGGAYDRNKTIDPVVLKACQPEYEKLARELGARSKGILLFSDGRLGGTRDHEELRPYHVALAHAIPAPKATTLPTPQPPEPPKPPKPPTPPQEDIEVGLPTYDQVVWPKSDKHPTGDEQMHRILEAFRQVPGNSPLPDDGQIGHLAYRLLVEGWTVDDIIRGIRGEPPVKGPGGAFPPRRAQ